jgi:hypothetical protein
MKRTTLKTGTNQFVILTPLNARSVSVSSMRIKPTALLNDNDETVKLIYDKSFILERGSQVSLGKEPFKISYIENADPDFLLHASKLTKASYFLMPTIGETRSYFMWSKHFVNCFISTESDIYLDHGCDLPCVYLLYRFSKSIQYSNFEKKIQSNELFIGMYDVDPFHVLYVLKIPEHLFDEYEQFMKGKYSKFHVKYKEQILTFHNAPRTSDLYGILWKTRQFREKLETKLTGIVERESDIIKIDPAAELHDPPLLEEEMYLEKYKIKKIIKPNVEYE